MLYVAIASTPKTPKLIFSAPIATMAPLMIQLRSNELLLIVVEKHSNESKTESKPSGCIGSFTRTLSKLNATTVELNPAIKFFVIFHVETPVIKEDATQHTRVASLPLSCV